MLNKKNTKVEKTDHKTPPQNQIKVGGRHTQASVESVEKEKLNNSKHSINNHSKNEKINSVTKQEKIITNKEKQNNNNEKKKPVDKNNRSTTEKSTKEKENLDKTQKFTQQIKKDNKAIEDYNPEDTFSYAPIKKENLSQPVKPIVNSNKKTKKIKKKGKGWKIALTILIILMVIGSVAFAALYSYLNKSFDSEDEEALKAKDTLTQASFDEPFYMVLVGTDTRAENQEPGATKTYSLEGGRSDTCMLVRIDPKQYKVTVISIPRDTQVTINGSTEKFNAAYNYGGIAGTIEQVKKLCNVEVAHYAEVSFNGLVDMVDAVGGVEVDVPEAINDPKSGAPVPQGKQTLNGEQALSFARSRNFADGDFTRSADQRILVEALINKAYNLNVGELPGVLRAAKNFVKTDLTLSQMVGLATQFKNANQLTIYSAMVPSTTGMEGGVSYCYADKEALGRMMKMAENGEDVSMLEVTSGASIGSSRDDAAHKQKQAEYYAAHPDSPGRAPGGSGGNSTSSSSGGSTASKTNGAAS